MSKRIFLILLLSSLITLLICSIGIHPQLVSAQGPDENKEDFKDAILQGIQARRWKLPEDSSPDIQLVTIEESWGVAFVYFIDPNSGELLQLAPGIIPGRRDQGGWSIYFPSEADYPLVIRNLPRTLLPDSFLIPLRIQRDGLFVQAARDAGKLPWACNQSRYVTQDRQNSGKSHYPGGPDEWAWDFGLGSDEAVLASRSGTVAHIFTGTPKNTGKPQAGWWTANRVVIDHGDGTAALYMHLSDISPPVSEGQGISAGDIIGYADHTGRSEATHLHFALQPWNSSWNGNVSGTLWYQHSIESLFSDSNISGGNPLWGAGAYKSGNCGSSGTDNTGPRARFWSQPDYKGMIVFEKGKGVYENQNINSFSLEIPPNWSVETWKADGRYKCWEKSINKLHDHGWENGISKIRVHDHNACPQVQLFSDINFGGHRVFSRETGFYNDPSGNTLSMKIPFGWSVQTWRGDNQTGEKRCWSKSEPKLQDHGWERAIQSIYIYDHNVCSVPIRVKFTTGLGYAVQVEIVVTELGNDQNRHSLNVSTTDTQGNDTVGFQLPERITPGKYDVYVKPSGHLRKRLSNVQLNEGFNTLNFSDFKKGDINNNNSVDINDLLLVLSEWGLGPSSADLNRDGKVDVLDLLIVLQNWGSGDGWSGSELSTTGALTIIGTQDITSFSTVPTVANGDFELGPNGAWIESSTNYGGQGSLILNITLPVTGTARSGNWLTWLGFANNEISDLSQTITIPTGGPVYLHYWYQIRSDEFGCSFDQATVLVNSTQHRLHELCESNNTSEWVLDTIDMSSYAGQSVTVHFHTETDFSISSSFFIDDVFFSNTPNAPARIILSPNVGTFNVNNIFEVQVILDTGSYSSKGLDARILYDPGVLEIQDTVPGKAFPRVTPGNLFDQYHIHRAYPDRGEIIIAATGVDPSTGNSFSGRGVAATMTFKVIAAITNTVIEVDYQEGESIDSDVIDNTTNVDVLGQVTSATYQTTGSPARVMPMVSLTPSANANVNSSLVELKAATTDPYNQVKAVKFEVKLNGVWTELSTDNYSQNGWGLVWDASSVPDGTFSLRATAYLLGGVGTTVTNSNIFLDRVPPTYAFSNFTPLSTNSPGTPVTIEVIATDEGSGVDHIDVYVNSANDGSTNGSWNFLGSVSGDDGNVVWNTSGYSSGVYQIAFDIPDLAGNHGPDPQPHLLYEITAQSEGTTSTFLPLIVKGGSQTPPPPPAPSITLNGTVTDKGAPVISTEVLLRYYDGSSWSTYKTITTDVSGKYQFSDLPNLGPNQWLYVLWLNSDNDPNRLWSWSCEAISSSTTDPNAYQCNFDLDNVDLVMPDPGTTVTLPQTFTFSKRSITSDSYELNLADMNSLDPWWWTNQLGYVNSYTLNNLPSEFLPGQQYGWWMWVYGPNGHGVSYYYRSITFSNSGTTTVDVVPLSAHTSKENIEEVVPPQLQE